MLPLERQRSILNFVRRNKNVGVNELIAATGYSPATVRRDLSFLEAEGKLLRTHGGVVSLESIANEPTFSFKQKQATREKQRMSTAAAALVGAGQTVFIDAGSTCLDLGQRLLQTPEVTLYTNSLPLLFYASQHPGRVVALGGEIRGISRALVGAGAEGWLQSLHFDCAFIGASGLSAEGGASTTELLEASIKKRVVAQSRLRVLMADASKWQSPSVIRFAAWDEFEHWITDARLSAAEARALNQKHRKLKVTRA